MEILDPRAHMPQVVLLKLLKGRLKKPIIVIIAVCVLACAFFVHDASVVGKELDSYKGVTVYYNGIIYVRTYGQNYSDSGYYYGYKWQCVEYIKRFYFEAKNHGMPDGLGNAKDFFDPSVGQGELNASRGLAQYRNGGDVPPQPDDLLVFNDRKYGHVAIVVEVAENHIEVIQQNVLGKTRDRLLLKVEGGKYFVGKARKPAGWLRLE